MKQSFYKSLALSSLMLFSQTAFSGQSEHSEVRAFYGDKKGNTVVVIDVKRMQLEAKIPTEGLTPYPVDRAGYLDKVYAITRGSFSMDVIDADTLEKIGLIPLTHKPRSGESFNSRLGLALVAGADIPITSVIDVTNDVAVAVTAEDPGTDFFADYGGGNASGHPAWLSKDRFVVIDRPRRLIQLWGIEKVQSQGHRHRYGGGNEDSSNYHWELTILDTVSTPTSVHHILSRNTSMLLKHEKRVFYALAEGKQADDETEDAIQPAILKLRLTGNDQLIYEDRIDLSGDATEMGAHHADFHPDGRHIYVGSTEGNLFILDSKREYSTKTIKTGLGTGHTRFIPAKNLAIVTNHNDTFVTVIDTSSNTKIKDIYFPFLEEYKEEGEILQSHTNYVSPDNNFYYAFASAYGIFFEITLDLNPNLDNTENPENLDNLKISNTLKTGGVPVQGSFLNSDYFSYSATHSSSGM